MKERKLHASGFNNHLRFFRLAVRVVISWRFMGFEFQILAFPKVLASNCETSKFHFFRPLSHSCGATTSCFLDFSRAHYFCAVRYLVSTEGIAIGVWVPLQTQNNKQIMYDKLYFRLLGLRAEESSSGTEGRDFLRRTKEKKKTCMHTHRHVRFCRRKSHHDLA